MLVQKIYLSLIILFVFILLVDLNTSYASSKPLDNSSNTAESGLYSNVSFTVDIDTEVVNTYEDSMGVNIEDSISSEKIYIYTNLYRHKFNLNPLKQNDKLNNAAMSKALHMVRNGYFSDTSPSKVNYKDFVKESDYKYKYLGENISSGFTDTKSLFIDWTSHLDTWGNITNKDFEDVGIAIVKDYYLGNENTLVVMIFGKQKESSFLSNLWSYLFK